MVFRVVVLKDFIYSILDGDRLTWRQLGEKHNISPEKARKWWRYLIGVGITNNEWQPGVSIEPEWVSKIKEAISISTHGTNVASSPKPSGQESIEKEYKGDTAHMVGKTPRNIQSLEDALDFFEVDTEVWDVDRYRINSWGSAPNIMYQVKVDLKRKDTASFAALGDLINKVRAFDFSSKRSTIDGLNKLPSRANAGVVLTADFHIGADVKGLMRTPDFNIEVLLDKLNALVERVNELNYNEVHFAFLGDAWESLSGLNHIDTFKSLGQDMWGANVMILATEIFANHIISKINNLKSFYIIAGNHDRLASDKKQEPTYEGSNLLYYMLKQKFPDLEIVHNNLLVRARIDGINYLFTHGDRGLNNKDVSKVVFDYGDSRCFNVLAEGHYHSRRVRKTSKATLKRYQDVDVVSMDEQKYRKLTVPSIFTGNFFSESLGFSGTSGFNIIENNGNGFPNVFDFVI